MLRTVREGKNTVGTPNEDYVAWTGGRSNEVGWRHGGANDTEKMALRNHGEGHCFCRVEFSSN